LGPSRRCYRDLKIDRLRKILRARTGRKVMAKYLSRTCPRCGDYFGIVMPQRIHKAREHPVNGLCAVCGYKLTWKVIPGKTLPSADPDAKL
jgi:predicted RNA-binding Zn-ribbon protein involved in translation (DUF1610 family)